jgi:hypothetical protein
MNKPYLGAIKFKFRHVYDFIFVFHDLNANQNAHFSILLFSIILLDELID